MPPPRVNHQALKPYRNASWAVPMVEAPVVTTRELLSFLSEVRS